MRKILLDCGSHLGESIKKFKTILNSSDFEFYMFEPNIFLFEQINSNSEFEECKKFNNAVSNKNEIVKFWGCTGNNKSSVGATLEKSKADSDNISENDYIEIPSIDLSEFIVDNFSKKDFIILKLDIEGSEYDVLEKLFDTNVIEYINELYIEFHSQWLSPEFNQREIEIRNNLQRINLTPNYWDAL